MKYDPEKHHRRSIRLKGYDYSLPGAYFITICTHQRDLLFGEIMDGVMHLNPFGQIVVTGWLRSAEIRQEIDFDAWVIMPNHLHGIVLINSLDQPENPVGADGRPPLPSAPQTTETLHRQPRSLSSFIAGFKSATTKQINLLRCTPRAPVWQRNYYEHIIRDTLSFERIQHYIQTNPQSWQSDRLHPEHLSER